MSRSDVKSLADLLTEPFELDLGSVQYLVEQSLQQGPDHAVQVVGTVLSGARPAGPAMTNLASFIRQAVAQDLRVRPALRKATKRRGRCPAKYRDWMEGLFVPPSAAVRTDRQATHSQSPDAALDLRDLRGSIAELPQVVERIAAVPDGAARVRITLGSFTYASMLAVLAQSLLARGLGDRYEISRGSRGTPESTCAYLERIGFHQALRSADAKISGDPMDWAVGLTRINRNQPSERVTRKVVDILEVFVAPKRDERNAISTLVGEMIENIHRHAQAPVDGFAVAQLYPKKMKLGITFVDAGIGIRASFEQGDPSQPIAGLTSDSAFLQHAVKLHTTSKRRGHAGYGLYLLSELIARNRGTMFLSSGGASLTGFQKRGRTTFEVATHGAWRGTIVSVVIDLHEQLPLLQIYSEIPPVAGMGDDELFD